MKHGKLALIFSMLVIIEIYNLKFSKQYGKKLGG